MKCWGDLRYVHLVDWRDDSAIGFAARMAAQVLAVSPTDLDRTAGAPDRRRNARTKGWFNDWDQSHPCAEGLLPWDTFPQFLIEVMSELPAPVARSARTMLGTFQGQRFTSAFLARPEGDMIMGVRHAPGGAT